MLVLLIMYDHLKILVLLSYDFMANSRNFNSYLKNKIATNILFQLNNI